MTRVDGSGHAIHALDASKPSVLDQQKPTNIDMSVNRYIYIMHTFTVLQNVIIKHLNWSTGSCLSGWIVDKPTEKTHPVVKLG